MPLYKPRIPSSLNIVKKQCIKPLYLRTLPKGRLASSNPCTYYKVDTELKKKKKKKKLTSNLFLVVSIGNMTVLVKIPAVAPQIID